MKINRNKKSNQSTSTSRLFKALKYKTHLKPNQDVPWTILSTFEQQEVN